MQNTFPLARYILLLLLLLLAPTQAHAGALLDAVASGDAGKLSAALSDGTDRNERDSEGETPMHAAVRLGRADMVRLLLDHGTDADAVNDWQETPLSLAILNYRKKLDLDIVELLLARGANPGLLKWSEKAAFFGGESEMPVMRLLMGAGFTPSDDFIVQMAERGSPEAARYVFARPYDITVKGRAHEVLRTPGRGERREVADAIAMGLKGRGRVALDRARRDGNLSEFIALPEQGADPDGMSDNGSVPIILSEASKGRREYVLALIKHGADIDATDYPGETALWKAVEENDCDMIRLLIEYGADPEHKDKEGLTPMNIAAYGDRDEARLCLEELTGRKPTKPERPAPPVPVDLIRDLTGKTSKEERTVHLSKPKRDSTFLFLDRDGKPAPQAGRAPQAERDMPERPELLAIAERANDATTSRILAAIEQSGDGNIRNSFGQNILIRLISLKAPDPEDSFRTLIGMGADIDIVDQDRLTPLLYAIGSHDFEATRALLKLGAKTEIPGRSPNALHFALSRHCFKEARLLLDSGVDVNVPGPNRDTPLHQACQAAPRELISHMLDSGARVNAREKTGMTPLHAAAYRGDPVIVRMLLDSGADRSMKDNTGRTPRDISLALNHGETSRILAE